MKKILFILMTVVLVLVCCSCGESNAFEEGNLLYDLGAKSFEDIEKVEFLYEEYQGDYEDKLVITQKKDIELLLDYKYSSDYPSDKLHELFIYPTKIGILEFNLSNNCCSVKFELVCNLSILFFNKLIIDIIYEGEN